MELVLPAVGYLIRMLDGRIDIQGTIKDLQERKLLQSITHDENVSVKAPQPADEMKSTEQSGTTTAEPSSAVTGEPSVKKARELVKAEERAVGSVSSQVYGVYLKATCV